MGLGFRRFRGLGFRGLGFRGLGFRGLGFRVWGGMVVWRALRACHVLVAHRLFAE